jgi:hypothetical protein
MLSRLEFSRDPQALFLHVETCWQEAANGRPYPLRTEISPSKLGRALPYVTLMDVIDERPMDFQYRLIGQHLIMNTGQNLTGKRTLHLPSSAETGRPIYECLTRCVVSRAPIKLDLDVRNMNGNKRRMHMALWPLGAPDAQPTAILGAALFQE